MVPDGILMAASRYSKILERCDKWRCRQCLPPVLLKDFTDWRCPYWLTTYQPTYYRLCFSEIPLIELPVGRWTLSDPLALHQSSLWTIDDLSFLTISKQTFYFIISLQAFNTHAWVCVCVMNINLSSPVLPFRPKKCFRQIVLKSVSMWKLSSRMHYWSPSYKFHFLQPNKWIVTSAVYRLPNNTITTSAYHAIIAACNWSI